MAANQNQPQQKYKNPVETLVGQGKGYSIAEDIEAQKAQFEQEIAQNPEFDLPQGPANPEFKDVFNYLHHSETKEVPQKINEIQNTIEQIKSTIHEIKRSSDGVNAEVEAIERAAMQSIGEKPGVYHVRYLELLLSFLQGVKAKVGEAKTWLMAMQSKKAKRGSAFATRSKKQGTQFSLSQELQTARNVQ